MNYKGIYRTAPATPGLLTMKNCLMMLIILKNNVYCKYFDGKSQVEEETQREHFIGCQGVNMFLLKDSFKVFSSDVESHHISSLVTI